MAQGKNNKQIGSKCNDPDAVHGNFTQGEFLLPPINNIFGILLYTVGATVNMGTIEVSAYLFNLRY